MRLSIAYARAFKMNLSQYIQEQKAVQLQEVVKVEEETKKITQNEPVKRNDLYLDYNDTVAEKIESKVKINEPLVYTSAARVVVQRPDLSEKILQAREDIKTAKQQLWETGDREQNSIDQVKSQLSSLESTILQQDLRNKPR